MFKMSVKILPRPEVLDTQGRAVEQTLKQLGHGLETCQVGRYVTVTVDASDLVTAKKEVEKMAQEVLANPLIEEFVVEEA